MSFDAEGFDRNVPLPPDLKISHIRKAIEYIEREATELIEVYYEQANVFSGLVGIWRYLVDPAKIIKAGKSVLIWRVDVTFLHKKDWKYEGSKAREGRGGRTHTFGVKLPARRFAKAVVYRHPKIVLRQSKPTLANGEA